MKKIVSVLSGILAAMVPWVCKSQETNYWIQNYGAYATLKGGIEVAGSENASAIYYNPGSIAFFDDNFLEAQADVVSMDIITFRNALGDGIDADIFPVNAVPSILAYQHKLKNKPTLHYAMGVLTRHHSNYSFLANYEQRGAYLQPAVENDVFRGQYSYNNRIRENWLVGALAYRISPKVGLGLATNVVVRVQDYDRQYNAQAFPEDELGGGSSGFSKTATTNEYEGLDHRVLGFVFKPGINVRLDKLTLGAAVTSPNISLGLLTNQTRRSQISNMPDEVSVNQSATDAKKFYSGVYKTPFSVSLGAEYKFDNVNLALTTEWFARIRKYEMIRRNDGSEDLEFPTSGDPNYAIPVMAHKSILNIGAAVSYRFRENMEYIGSFRTDLSYLDEKALNPNEDFIPNMFFLDIYHFTSGLVISGPRAKIAVGIDYGLGHADNNTQLVNMTTATQANRLKGTTNRYTEITYHNFSVTLGFNFNINRQKGLRTDKI